MTTKDRLADVLADALLMEAPLGGSMGVVEMLQSIARANGRIANAISADAAPGIDAIGGTVNSLTEAVMGVTGGLCRIADAMESIAEAIRESGTP